MEFFNEGKKKEKGMSIFLDVSMERGRGSWCELLYRAEKKIIPKQYTIL